MEAVLEVEIIKTYWRYIMAHATQNRLRLWKGLKDNRIFKIYDSPNLSEDEATYCIISCRIDEPSKMIF